MSGRDTIMMIIAFVAGLILVTAILGGSPQNETKKEAAPSGSPLMQPASMPAGQMVGLGDGYFLYHSPEDRFFFCRRDGESLLVLDVYTLERRELTYHAGAGKASGHGWSFESMSREKEAVLEAKSKQFANLVGVDAPARQDWAGIEELAREIAAVGGVDFLKSWLEPKKDWGGRRAAALALAERGYVESVPALADMLLEGPDVRERAASLLVNLTGEDFFEGPKRQSQEKAIDKYKEWYAGQRKGGGTR